MNSVFFLVSEQSDFIRVVSLCLLSSFGTGKKTKHVYQISSSIGTEGVKVKRWASGCHCTVGYKWITCNVI